MNQLDTPPPAPKKKHGCFFYGCITSLILLLLICVGGYLTVRMVINRANKMIADYTDTAPVSLPKVELSADEMKKLNGRVAAFSKAVAAHTNTSPLVLSGPELNALLADNENVKQFKDKIYVSLEGEAIKGQVSLPLDDFDGVPMMHMFHLKGRYLNGSGTFKAGITNGTLTVYIKSLEAKGKPLPAEFMTAFGQQNMAEGFNKTTNATTFEQYESIQVKDGNLIVIPRKEN